MSKAIGTIGNIPTLTVAGRVFTDLSSLIRLYTRYGSNASGTFRTSNASSGYAVTSGKTLAIEAIKINCDPSGTGSFNIAQSDNDVGIDSATALTSPVYLFGNNSTSNIQVTAMPNSGGSAGSGPELPIYFTVAATKYATANGGTGQHMTVFAFGYET